MSNKSNKNNKKALLSEINKLLSLLESNLPFGSETNVQKSNTMTRQEMQDMYEKLYDAPLSYILDLMSKAEQAQTKSLNAKKDPDLTTEQKFFYDKMFNVAVKQIAVLKHLPAYQAYREQREEQRREENRKSSEARLAAMTPEEKKKADLYAQYGGEANYKAGRGLGT